MSLWTRVTLTFATVLHFLWSLFVFMTTGRWSTPCNLRLTEKMSQCQTYEQWRPLARLVDEDEGMAQWRVAPEASFSLDLLEARIRLLAAKKKEGNPHDLLKAIRADIHRSTFGITNAALFPYRTAAKTWIATYTNLMVHLIRSIAVDERVAPTIRYRALKDMQLAYGSSALLLNGSIALGAYHLGVVKGLLEAKLLPQVIFGCNTGALVAACLCCLPDIAPVVSGAGVNFTAFDKRGSSGSMRRKWNRLLKEGTLMGVTVLQQFAKDNLGELTFAEAYQLTGRILNINVGLYMGKGKGVGSWLLNYLTTPNVLVYTAAVASCATAFVYGNTTLLAKSISGDIVPFDPPALSFSDSVAAFHINDALVRLRELFNVKLSIVSEVSVTRLPFLRLEHRSGTMAKVGHFFTEELWRAAAYLSRLEFFQTRLTGALQTIADGVKGDLVVYPVSTPTDLFKLLSNPNLDSLHYCIWRGEQQLWPRLPLLKTHIAPEIAVANGIRYLEEMFPFLKDIHESPSSRGRRLHSSICVVDGQLPRAKSMPSPPSREVPPAEEEEEGGDEDKGEETDAQDNTATTLWNALSLPSDGVADEDTGAVPFEATPRDS